MYGLVNKAVEDLAVHVGGQETWDAIRRRAGIDEPTFVGMKPYPDEITLRLVEAASEVLGLPPEQVLEAFGEHWVKYTAREGWGPLLAAAGSSLPALLAELDALHARVSLTMPALRPPSFACEELGPGLLRLEYRSERDGLAPMVVGLLRGLGDHFGVAIAVEHIERRANCGYDGFRVRYHALAAAA